tara:strand:- start:59 stop:385 length:327 start_codon:yes stop_codon:yes gene_type:complete
MNNGYYPYSTGIASSPIDKQLGVDSQIAKYKDDEKMQKVDKQLPHELARITELLGNTFVSLSQLRSMLELAVQNKELDQLGVNKIKEKIDKVNEIILDIPEDLDILGI